MSDAVFYLSHFISVGCMRLYACSQGIYFIRYCNLCLIFFPSFKMQLIFFPYETRAHENNSRRESYPMFAQSKGF